MRILWLAIDVLREKGIMWSRKNAFQGVKLPISLMKRLKSVNVQKQHLSTMENLVLPATYLITGTWMIRNVNFANLALTTILNRQCVSNARKHLQKLKKENALPVLRILFIMLLLTFVERRFLNALTIRFTTLKLKSANVREILLLILEANVFLAFCLTTGLTVRNSVFLALMARSITTRLRFVWPALPKNQL